MTQRIAIVGAGSIGCYVGGALMMGGAHLRFHGRARLGGELEQYGLTISDYRGLRHHIPPVALDYRESLAALDEVQMLIVTVKSTDTEALALSLAEHLNPGTLVLSLQNGVNNVDILRHHLPGQRVLAGMISFNVVQRGQGQFHAGTDGAVIVEDSEESRALAPQFVPAGVRFQTANNMPGVMWSKLLLNLNNVVNALSRLPLREQLAQRDYRRCLALLQDEALVALAAEGIDLPRINALPCRYLPRVLRLPNGLFSLLARRMLAIDPLARSSMWDDLQRGRPTEVESINGEVIRLAQRHHLPAPANEAIVALLHRAERGETRTYTGIELLKAIQ